MNRHRHHQPHVTELLLLFRPILAIQPGTFARLTESLAGTQTLVAEIEARLEAIEKLPAALLREVFGSTGQD